MIRGKFIFLIITVVFFVWVGAILGDFVYDDSALIVNNPFIKSPQNLGLLFSKNYISSPVSDFFYQGAYNMGSGESTYRPVATLSYFVNYALFGLKPWGYRLTNVLLHAVNAALVYILLLQLFAWPKFAILAGLLFGVHPSSAEVIACTGFRPNILAMLFSLLTIMLYFKAQDKASVKARYSFLALSLFCFFLAVFSKEIAVFLPLALFTCEYYRKNCNFKKVLSSWKSYLWYLALPLVYLAVYFFLMRPTQNIFDAGGWLRNTVRVADIFGAYLKNMVFPEDLVMIPPMAMLKSYFNITAGAVFLIWSGYVLLRKRKFSPEISFGILWFLIWALPMNNFFNTFRILIANRFLYIPLVGFTAVIAVLLIKFGDKKNILTARLPSLKYILPLASLSYFSIFAFSNSALWKNELLICMSVVEKYPESPTARVDLGETWFKRGNYPEALYEFDIAVSKAQGKLSLFDFVRVYSDAGQIFMARGEYKRAEEKYREAIAVTPNMPYFYVALGSCYAKQGFYDKALKELAAAKNINPLYVPAYLKGGTVYSLMRKYEDARQEFQRALKIDPHSQEAKQDLDNLEEVIQKKK